LDHSRIGKTPVAQPNTGCCWDGSMKGVHAETIFVQKTYDAALCHLQGIKTVANLQLQGQLPMGSTITEVLDVRAKKFFNAANLYDPRNLTLTPTVSITGAHFVEDGCGNPVTVMGPDGLSTQKLIHADGACATGCGTPVYGTQTVNVTGDVLLEIDVAYTQGDDCCNPCEREATLTARVNVGSEASPLVLTSFFQLSLPNIEDSAFLPRFAEFCNVGFDARLVSNTLCRDITVDACGCVTANVLILILVSCEKKIVVPVQLCVLSTGYPKLQAATAPMTQHYPQLFPDTIACCEQTVCACEE